MELQTLKAALAEWADIEAAEYVLGLCLGLYSADANPRDLKHVFFSNNPVGNLLHQILDELVANGILEARDEPDFEFRWNRSFKGSWEEPWQLPASAP